MPRGISGYDPEDKDMRGVFMARGPGKKIWKIATAKTYWRLATRYLQESYPQLRNLSFEGQTSNSAFRKVAISG